MGTGYRAETREQPEEEEAEMPSENSWAMESSEGAQPSENRDTRKLKTTPPMRPSSTTSKAN